MVEQGSDEWFAARLGKITASRVSDVMAKTRSGYGASRKNYMMELLCQRLTGKREEGYTSPAMLRGIELEPVARSAYEMATDRIVEEAGFVLHPHYTDIGASPDGFVGSDGLIEIKCPNTAQHVACLQTNGVDSKYWWQIQCQLFCTDRKWCDFASFDDRMPEELQLFVFRVNRDDQAISDMLDECLEFIGELNKLEEEMRGKMRAAA